MAALSLRLPDELASRLDGEARRGGAARSDVARQAIEEFLARRERERFIAGFVAEARAAYGDPSFRAAARELAAEALMTDNEALAIAEGGQRNARGGGRPRKPGR
jgi:predicted transcriptional regulator